jgi:predicted Zn finger-like uncharacterized protein
MTMEILCPECQFSREVDEAKIPARSQIATCPRCKTKFKFRELPEEEFSLDDPDGETAAQPSHAAEPPAGDALEPPTPEQVKPAFPGLSDDGDDADHDTPPARTKATTPKATGSPDDEIWDRLGDMRPPAGGQPRRSPEPEEKSDAEPISGWTGEFSEDFPDPMGDTPRDPGGHDDHDDREGSAPQVPPPFEQLDRYGFFPGLYMTIKLVLRSPRLFFAVMPVGGGLAKPLTFTILLTMVQGLFQYFWQMAGLSTSMGASADPGAGASAAGTLMMLLLMPAVIAAGQFAITGVYHLLLVVMRAADQGFEGTFRALAYANAPIILGVFPMPSPEIEIGWMIFAALWVLWLTIVGLKHIHRTSYAKVVPAALIPLLLGMIGGVMAFYSQLATI